MGQDDEDFKIKAHTTNFVEIPAKNSYCLFACQSAHLWCRLVMDRKKNLNVQLIAIVTRRMKELKVELIICVSYHLSLAAFL